jgi:hypothetical protein
MEVDFGEPVIRHLLDMFGYHSGRLLPVQFPWITGLLILGIDGALAPCWILGLWEALIIFVTPALTQ